MSEIEKYLKDQEERLSFSISVDKERLEMHEKELNRVQELLKRFSSEKPEGKTNPLINYKTCELVEELKTREGVETHWAEPYEDKNIQVNGPALVLVVID